MSFAHPAVLLVLLLPLAVLVWGWRRHGRRVPLPFDHAQAPPRRWTTGGLRLAHSLPLVVLAIAIIILAGPRRWGLPQDQRIMTNIEFVVDVSGSMMSGYGDGNRYDAAMASVLEFVDTRQGDAFGLIVFGDSILEWVPLTSDPSALRCAPEFLNPMKLPPWFSGGTSIGAALEHTLKVMTARSEGDRMVILLTDGYSYDLANGRDIAIASKLEAAGIQVFCIHIDNSPPPVEVTTIASRTGGQVFAAGNPDSLRQVFARIDQMKKARLQKISAETQDDFRPWALTGGGLLLVWIVSCLAGFRFTPW
jgi:Ca-activated chloride channel family protein